MDDLVGGMTSMEVELAGVKKQLQRAEQKAAAASKNECTGNKEIVTCIKNTIQSQYSVVGEQLGEYMQRAVERIEKSNSSLINQIIEKSSNINKPGINEQKQKGVVELRSATERKMNEIINLCNDSCDTNRNNKSNAAEEDKSKTNRQNRQGIKGTNNRVAELAAACERKWIYIDNLAATTTTEQLKVYMEQSGARTLSCEKLETKDPHKACFKVAIEPQFEEMVMRSDMWPVSVTVRYFVSNWRQRNGRFQGHIPRRNFARGNRGRGSQ